MPCFPPPQASGGRYPYSVSLQDRDGHFCGGSLVARDVVLTAAHCLTGLAFDVRVGSDAVDGGVKIGVRREAIHPQNDAGSDQYDLALVFLRTAVDLPLVRINDQNDAPAAGERVTAMGWGRRNADGGSTDMPDQMHEVRLDVIANAECAAAENGHESYRGWIYDSMLCTSTPKKDAW